MKRAILIFSILCCSLVQCGYIQDEDEVPADVMSKTKFTEVLTDVQLLEATMKQRFIREEDPKVLYAVYYDQVFKKHEISKDEFVDSFNYWSDRDEEMKEVYDKVIENLARMSEPVEEDIKQEDKSDQ